MRKRQRERERERESIIIGVGVLRHRKMHGREEPRIFRHPGVSVSESRHRCIRVKASVYPSRGVGVSSESRRPGELSESSVGVSESRRRSRRRCIIRVKASVYPSQGSVFPSQERRRGRRRRWRPRRRGRPRLGYTVARGRRDAARRWDALAFSATCRNIIYYSALMLCTPRTITVRFTVNHYITVLSRYITPYITADRNIMAKSDSL